MLEKQHWKENKRLFLKKCWNFLFVSTGFGEDCRYLPANLLALCLIFLFHFSASFSMNEDSNFSAVISRPSSAMGLIIDSPSPQNPVERGTGRGRRGRGSSRGASPRTRGSKSGTSSRGRGAKSRGGSLAAAAAAAAAAAGAAAASAAAYAAHGFSFQATGPQYGTNSNSSKWNGTHFRPN